MKINCMIGITDSKGNRINTSCDVCPKYDSCSVLKFEMGLKQQEKSVNTFSFGQALVYLREGKAVKRKRWSKYVKVKLDQNVMPHQMMIKDCSETYYKYHPSDKDLLANDWIIVSKKKKENSKTTDVSYKCDTMLKSFTFESALSYLKEGYTAIRHTWPKGKLLVMQKGYPEGIPCNEQTAKTWGLNEGDLFKCAPYLQINEGDMHYMYAPSIEDLFAEDWFIIFNKEIEIEE